MEHRASPRQVVVLPTALLWRGVAVASGRTLNVSRHGLFVETDSRRFHMHQPFRIDIAGDDGRRYQLMGMVVHCAANGVGIELLEPFDTAVCTSFDFQEELLVSAAG